MSQIAATGATSSASSSADAAESGLNDLNLDDFLTLLITEMQNQDPLNPMENAEMLQQIGQIREIGATNDLTETLGNLSLSQQLTTASNLIGREVSGLSDDSEEITGKIDRVSVETDSDGGDSRNVKVHVGEKTIQVSNIREIVEG
ncbi:Basal-body rod modification protein FlgD [Rosistilla oblonga]|uniref:Basal-body rod modification protein FlgD n=1 Tax=Rosistilla oblonga TaxID=2527990 RepID=A0A518IPM5_9BACT|nr:flagellar hook capping FlgD N-terminal domain-containing protein [Rosistilla oblonga]QDV11113.1 Basal-body rod modification protein FlgD [Rosistilla oblonga]QDV55033.1 Basal-body rod modification protein FlgD [Rosistilla oblonga]